MANRTVRDNTLAGLFVLGGIALAVWSSFMLGEQTGLGGMSRVTVQFPVGLGSHGLKPGALVMLGGQKIGNVDSISFSPKGGTPTHVDVAVELPRQLKLMSDAVFTLERPLLGSISSINITSGGGAAAATELGDGAVVAGGLAPPALLSQSGLGPEDMTNLRDSLSSLDKSMDRIATLIDQRSPDIDRGIIDARAIIADIKARLGPWADMVGATLDNAHAASERLRPMADKASVVIDDAKAFIASVQAVVEQNRESIRSAVASVESIADKVDKQMLADLAKSLESATKALESVDQTVTRVSTLVSSETPNVQRTIANLRLMADNLKLTSIEVRSQPWRLLHQPTRKDISTQALYDSTRAYAEAGSDLRAASESLRALVEARQAGIGDQTAIDEASRLLARTAEQYKTAERRLLELLVKDSK
ncbi:MAG: MlaD family protein [Phycisphaerae bacterium]|jgi:ABC-type transporter Mla subunit MlaD